MKSRFVLFAGLVTVAALPLLRADQAEIELLAKRRVFPEMGAGLVELKWDAAGQRYLVLTSRGGGVAVYNKDGQRMGQIPPQAAAASSAAKAPAASILFAGDFDILSGGRIVVADRGANALKIFDAAGNLLKVIPTPAPNSVATLPEGELAVASSEFAVVRGQPAPLVTVFDQEGRVARDFGEPLELATRRDLNRYLNIGRVASDAKGALYYSFTFMPEPTVRRFDRFGYATLELVVATQETLPAAQAARREITRQDQKGGVPQLKPVVNAVGVNPDSGEIWIALGNVLLLYDRDGGRLGAYRVFTDEGARLEPVAILVTNDRLLLASDPLGVWEFPRPDRARPD